MTIQPRFLRPADAAAYLGVARTFFDKHIRPALTEIPLGKRALAFDRLELDQWVDDYKARNGRVPSREVSAFAQTYTMQPPPAPRVTDKPVESSPKRLLGMEKTLAAIAVLQRGEVIAKKVRPTKAGEIKLSVEEARGALIEARREAVAAKRSPGERHFLGKVEKARRALKEALAKEGPGDDSGS